MYELLRAGGLIMIPILICSVVALAIIFERMWTLRRNRVAPQSSVKELMARLKRKELNGRKLKEVRDASPLGRVLSSGLLNAKHGREIMKESIEEEASHVVHELERFLSTLGTIAAITPLLGLLGTVIGMIDVFAEIQLSGAANNQSLAGGISKALITTAVGLTIAIPALACHRYFHRRVDDLVVEMEQQALKLVEIVHGDRDPEAQGARNQ